MSQNSEFSNVQRITVLAFSALSLLVCGCQDGPLYAIKAANPYFSIREWKADEELGVTDHTRRTELSRLASSIDSMSNERQTFWTQHLEKIMLNDKSSEMRRLAVNAAGKITAVSPMRIIDLGLEDENTKVRMEACRALGRRSEPEAASALAKTAGSETDEDVKHAALAALSNHKGAVAVQSLQTALNDRNPATQELVINSLKSVTGQDHGADPQKWIAALQAPRQPAEPKTRLVTAKLDSKVQ